MELTHPSTHPPISIHEGVYIPISSVFFLIFFFIRIVYTVALPSTHSAAILAVHCYTTLNNNPFVTLGLTT